MSWTWLNLRDIAPTWEADMKTYSFETPPAPISPAAIKEVVETDIVVAGAGPAGLAAATSAAQAGARVLPGV